MIKYLVTGGAGFIGSHIVEALLAAGHRVTVLDDLSTGSRENLAAVAGDIEFLEGDIRDAETCRRAAAGCEGIFHEAALVSVPESVEHPRKNHEINVTGLFNVLEAARANGVRRIVFASSAAVYGAGSEEGAMPAKAGAKIKPKPAERSPSLREDMPAHPVSPYAFAKWMGENYLRLYSEVYGVQSAALRYFNVYGPRQRPDSMYSGVISVFLGRAKRGGSVVVYGDGGQTRDFINVRDVARANLLAMNHPEPFGVYNIATGRSRSLLDLIGLLERRIGRPLERRHGPPRAGDVRHSRANVRRAAEALKFMAEIALEEGLAALLA